MVIHDGAYHADDCACVYIIKNLLDPTCKLNIIRTRDDNIINKADIVADVGGIYNLE